MRKTSILALVALVCLFCCSPEKPVNTASSALAEFVEAFQPSAGRGRLRGEDEMSEASFAAQLAQTKDQLKKLREIDTAQLTFDEKIDWKFAQSILAGRELEQEKMQFWRKDPRLYMAFTGISDMINKPGDVAGKIEPIRKRLEITPTQLSNAKDLLTIHVPRFQELGLFMAENGFALFDQELPAFITSAGDEGKQLEEPAKQAREALTGFITFLKDELPKRTAGDFAIGLET